jgi:hypothetical protein
MSNVEIAEQRLITARKYLQEAEAKLGTCYTSAPLTDYACLTRYEGWTLKCEQWVGQCEWYLAQQKIIATINVEMC